MDYIQFAVLGLGSAAAYSLLASGLILIYRASGVLNFAQGAFAMAAAYLMYELRAKGGWSYLPALVVVVVVMAVVGALTYLLFIRPLRNAAPIVRIIATLSVLTILTAAANLRYHGSVINVAEELPKGTLHWGVTFPQDRLWLIVIAAVLTLLLWLVSARTRFGLATRATAENPRTAAAFGWSADLVATVNWAVGTGVAALAGIFIAPVSGLSSQSLTIIVVPALAVALFGAFSSFPLAFLGAVILGMAQGLVTKWQNGVPGISDVVPFALILLALIWRRQAIPHRGETSDRMPALGAGRMDPVIVLPCLVVGVLATQFLPVNWVVALGVSIVVGIILLSIVVVTGYAGQLSLGQYALAGLGVLVCAQIVTHLHWPFLPALVIGVIAAMVCGVLFGLPSLRSRGIQLAIVTLGMGTVVQSALFSNPDVSGGAFGFSVQPQKLFGLPFDQTGHPRTYAVIALAFFALCWFCVSNLRRSRVGLRMVSIRANERAAASLGVNVSAVKLYAFSLSAGLAAVGGILLGFSTQSIVMSQGFDPLTSITAVLLGVVGGVGHAAGPMFGSELASGGFPGGVIANNISAASGSLWLVLIGGVLVLFTLRLNPDGVATGLAALRRVDWPMRARPSVVAVADRSSGPAAEARPAHARPDAELVLSRLSVSFGGVHALKEVDLSLRSGQIIGLIGPNGSGKTTLIDAVTGYVAARGQVRIDGKRLDGLPAFRRARAGITRSFQSLELFGDVTVEENLRAAVDDQSPRAYATGVLPLRTPPLPPLAQTVVREFELDRVLHLKPRELSYGKRRLVAIARAVATNPSFLLLDEPAAGLSSAETEELSYLIARVAKVWNVGILLIEHDMSMVLGISDRVAVLEFGNKIADGTPDEIRGDAKVIAAYLGAEAEAADSASATVAETTS